MEAARVNSEILDRIPPNSQNAERAVLGSILQEPKVLDDLSLRPEEFYADGHRRLYMALLAMRAERQPVDMLLLLQRLKTTGCVDAVGGVDYLAKIADSVPYAYNAKYYAGIIRETARRRAIIRTATDMLRGAWDDGRQSVDVLEDAERELAAIHTNDSDRAIVTAEEATIRALLAIEAAYRGELEPRLATGIRDFDEQFGGLAGLVILAARLGVGKTALACQWADYSGSKDRLTYFASLEMDAAELATRILCSLSGVDSRRIDTGRLDERDVKQLSTAASGFSKRALRFDERPRLRVSDIRREARRMVKDGLRLVVVDYLQIVTPDDHRMPREQQVATIAKELKELSRELRIPVVALAQINRQVKDANPGPEHIRESDAIGQNADMVITISVDEKPTDGWDSRPHTLGWVRVGKNRNGPKGKMRVEWHATETRFSTWRTQEEQEDAEQAESFRSDFAAFS